VVIPGLNGDIGIESSERVLVYLLKAGVIYIFENNKVKDRYFIYSGQFLAKDNELTITIEGDLINLSKINKDEIIQKINTLKETLKETLTKTNTEDEFKTNFYQTLLTNEELLLTTLTESNY
jgi:F0F1-type ATP synthase epsilon subunit